MARLRGDLQRLEALLEAWEPQIREAFLQAVRDAGRAIRIADLEAAIATRDWQRVTDMLTLNQRFLFPLDAALVNTFVAGGQMIAAGIPTTFGVLGFDGRAIRAEQWARQHVGGLITNIAEHQRATITEAVRGVVSRQIEAGRGPRAVATDLVGRVNRATGHREGGILGLDTSRAARLQAVTEGMETAEGVRGLVIRQRDGTLRMRYQVNAATERRILRAYRAGEAVPAADRAISAAQYSNALLNDRAVTIARTESITALRAGRDEGIRQAIEQGVIAEDRLKRVWDATMDSRTRPDHRLMHGTTIDGLDAPFVLPDGSRMMFPGDVSLGASAAQAIQCRCFQRYEIAYLRG